MWTTTHFPAAMRSLHPSTRAKAIEIANDLQTKGDLERQQIIVQSISEARSQARRASIDLTAGYFATSRI